jgi:hypothetical protein
MQAPLSLTNDCLDGTIVDGHWLLVMSNLSAGLATADRDLLRCLDLNTNTWQQSSWGAPMSGSTWPLQRTLCYPLKSVQNCSCVRRQPRSVGRVLQGSSCRVLCPMQTL